MKTRIRGLGDVSSVPGRTVLGRGRNGLGSLVDVPELPALASGAHCGVLAGHQSL